MSGLFPVKNAIRLSAARLAIARRVGSVALAGTTLVLVEQNVEWALKLADRAIIIDQGEIVHRSSAAALLADKDIQDRYCAV